jgi:hypothetical protein
LSLLDLQFLQLLHPLSIQRREGMAYNTRHCHY